MASAAQKAPANTGRKGWNAVPSGFADSGDGWYQYPPASEADSSREWEGEYLGTVMVPSRDKRTGNRIDRPVHKFKLTAPLQGVRGAKGTEQAEKIVTLGVGKILLVYSKFELAQKLAGRDGYFVACKPTGVKKLGNGNTMWEYDVEWDPSRVPSADRVLEIKAANKKRQKSDSGDDDEDTSFPPTDDEGNPIS